MVAKWKIKWLLMGILCFCLVSCSQGTSTAIFEVADIDTISNSPTPVITITPIPVIATTLPLSSTNTPTLASSFPLKHLFQRKH